MTWDAWCQLCWDEYEAGYAVWELTLSGGDARELWDSAPPYIPPGVTGRLGWPQTVLNPATGALIPFHVGDTTEVVMGRFLRKTAS